MTRDGAALTYRVVDNVPEDVGAAEFGLAAWREELFTLNPWARERCRRAPGCARRG